MIILFRPKIKQEFTYQVVGHEHDHGGCHETVEDRHDRHRSRDADRDVVGGVLHLLGHRGHGIVPDVAQVHGGGAVEHARGTVGEESAGVSLGVGRVGEILHVPSPEAHDDDEEYKGYVECSENHVQEGALLCTEMTKKVKELDELIDTLFRTVSESWICLNYLHFIN
ncbi:putative cationic amino acid transporter 6, chloroplastic isoform X1 [Iris pallida]|uniref:Cationic amino acid transporter 6, chloroplastic isoform X1 n=1 Tax=Iris pallida TaxID=29817 RepID=A0AAX6I478_IRIPA|nr:putative cationic amino acid transporter 6, chloroplastic isoform X1 [Iris pallida]